MCQVLEWDSANKLRMLGKIQEDDEKSNFCEAKLVTICNKNEIWGCFSKSLLV